MEQPKIAFTVISKNRRDSISRLLDSTEAVFDYYVLVDTGSTDDTVKVWQDWCKAHNVKALVKEGFEYPTVEIAGKPVLADFALARNHTLELVKTTDAVFGFWADSDDVLVNPQAILQSAYLAQIKKLNFIFAKYNYAPIDPITGRSPIEQVRERLYRIDQKNLRWIHPVHENLVSDDMTKETVLIINDFYVQHLRAQEDAIEQGRRNKLIMERWIKETGIEACDFSVLRNYAFDAFEHKEYSTAKMYYKLALKKVKGANLPIEHVMDVYDKLNRISDAENKPSKMIKYGQKMVQLDPKNATGYLHLASGYLNTRQPELAITCADIVIQLGAPQQINAINVSEFDIKARQIAGEAYIQMNQVQEAEDVYKKLVEKYPKEKAFRDRLNSLYRAQDEALVMKALSTLELYMADRGLFDKQQALLQSIPEDLKQHPKVIAMINEMSRDVTRKLMPEKLGKNKRIAIYCGSGYEPWTPKNIAHGIGGSEEMVINMARELVVLGNTVDVFNECLALETFDGVRYIPFREFDNETAYDVLIIWRNPDMFRQVFNAKRQYLWLHDTYYGPHKARNFYIPNAVFVLSNEHRNIIKNAYGVKDSAFWVTANGVDMNLVPIIDEEKRHPHRVFYGSSYDRGLFELLTMWKDIKTEIPDAELHVCYGWNTFDAMANSRKGTPEGDEMLNYKEQVVELLKQDGVIHHGRMGQAEQLVMMGTCGIWAYPTWFSEISCITAMKAQIMGAIPVVTPVAALKETVKFGIKVGDEKLAMQKDPKVHEIYKQALLSLMKDEKRQDAIRGTMMKESRKLFAISELAKKWNEYFMK